MSIRNVGLIGLGTVGSIYGKYLFKRVDVNFFVIAGGERAKRIEENGIVVNSEVVYPKVCYPEDRKIKAELLLICVKSNQFDTAIADISNYVTDDTVILVLTSGISAVQKIKETYPKNLVMTGQNLEMEASKDETGVVNESMGSLNLGALDGTMDFRVDEVKQFLADSGIVSEVVDNVNMYMWKRWLINVGINQVVSILGLRYGQVRSIEPAKRMMRELMKETISVLQAVESQGNLTIQLDENDIEDAIKAIDLFPPNSKPSILQDLQSKRKTEVSAFSGMVVMLAEKLEVPSPRNKLILDIITSMEAMYAFDGVVI